MTLNKGMYEQAIERIKDNTSSEQDIRRLEILSDWFFRSLDKVTRFDPDAPGTRPFRSEADYHAGLQELQQRIGQNPNHHDEMQTHAARLSTTLSNIRMFGSNPTQDSELAKIIYNLNRFTTPILGISFYELSILSNPRIEAHELLPYLLNQFNELARTHCNGRSFVDLLREQDTPQPAPPPTDTPQPAPPPDNPHPAAQPPHIRLTDSEHEHFKQILGADMLNQFHIERIKDPVTLTLRFVPTADGATIWWESTLGTYKSNFTSPYPAQDLTVVIKALDALQYPEYPDPKHPKHHFSEDEQAILEKYSLWKKGRITKKAHHIAGQKLYKALIEDREADKALAMVRNAAKEQGRMISYVLRFPDERIELAALPWEALQEQRTPLLMSSGTRDLDWCTRYLNIAQAISPPLPAGQKLRLLALSPQAGTPDTIRQAEREAREKSWQQLKDRGLLEWDELSPVTARELDDWLRNHPRPDIVHYFGHGIYREDEGYLMFDKAGKPGEYELVSASHLRTLLGGIRLIFICACQSAMVLDLADESEDDEDNEDSKGNLLSGVAPALNSVSEAVVAMQLTVPITAATTFQEVFYEELARGRSLQAAVADGRRTLFVTEGENGNWYVPTLYIRTRDLKPVYLVQPLPPQPAGGTAAGSTPQPTASGTGAHPTTAQPAYNTAAIRELLTKAFRPQELRNLCYDYFREAYEHFAPGMDADQMRETLMEHCDQNLCMNELLQHINRVNPRQYAQYANQVYR
jgi:hypothetical protein